jgi:hypothetical protein
MPADHILPHAIDLLTETVHIFKTKFKQFVPFYVILALGFAVYPFIDADAGSGETDAIIVLPLFLVMWLLLTYGAAAVFTKLNDPDATKDAVVVTVNKRLLPFLGVSAIGGVLALAGLVLFIIPGLVIGLWYYLASCTTLFENTGVKASLVRSKVSLQGKWAEVFWKLFIVNSVPYILAWISVFIINTIIAQLQLQGTIVLILFGIEEVVFGLVKYALLLISIYLAYRYIKKKKS